MLQMIDWPVRTDVMVGTSQQNSNANYTMAIEKLILAGNLGK